MEQPESFQKKLEVLINQYSLENGSNTPDFILARYLDDCLQTFNTALKARNAWYGSAKVSVPAPKPSKDTAE